MMNYVKIPVPVALLLAVWPAILLAQESPSQSAVPLGEPAPTEGQAAVPAPAPTGPLEAPPSFAPPPPPVVARPAQPQPAAYAGPAQATASSLPSRPTTDVKRTKTQWLALNSYSGVMTSGHPLAGGALRLFRLRQEYSYITLISVRAARTTLAHGTAGYMGAFMQGGLKLTAGGSGGHVFYLGVEAGYGISGYTIRSTNSKQTVGIYLSPHIEYNCHFADGVALVAELKALPPLGRIQHEGTNEPSLWSFGGGLGLAF
jgi:hypothetical protein